MKHTIPAVSLLALLGCPAYAAPMAERFIYIQTAGNVTAVGDMTISYAAYANGLSVARDWGYFFGTDPASGNLAGTGILDLSFAVYADGYTVEAAMDDFRVYPAAWTYYAPSWWVFLSSTPKGLPTGSIYFNNYDSDAEMTDTGGRTATDTGGLCWQDGACTFEGHWELTQTLVPEPATWGLLGLSVLGLLSLRHRYHKESPCSS